MAPWVFDKKFPYVTQFLLRTLMFAAREDGDLELLAQGLTPCHRELIYDEGLYYPVDPLATSASNGAHSGLNSYVGPYTLASMMSWEHPIEVPTS
jgi:hypothetical protein